MFSVEASPPRLAGRSLFRVVLDFLLRLPRDEEDRLAEMSEKERAEDWAERQW